MHKYVTWTLFAVAMLPSASAAPPSRARAESSMEPDSNAYSGPPKQKRFRTASTLEPEPTIEEQFALMETPSPPRVDPPREVEVEVQVELRLSTRATGPNRITTLASANEFPYVVPYPDGWKSSVIARQYEEDGSWADLGRTGSMELYNKDGTGAGISHSPSDRCRASQGKGPCPRRALAKLYVEKYGPPPEPPKPVRAQPFSH